MLMVGPPGAGKSMLAQRLPGILPALTAEEMLDVSMIQSVAGLIEKGRLTPDRPFRAPHHSASMAAMVGGGLKVKPGEISLAHHGVLFLDELPEFSRQVLDSLRQPLETGQAVIARANEHVTFPARFQLVAAMNPCRCGYAFELGRACKRGKTCVADYQSRLSGPLLDRIDIHLTVPPVSAADLTLPPPGEGSGQVKRRVGAARDMQRERYRGTSVRLRTNAEADGQVLEAVTAPAPEAQRLLRDAVDRMRLTARGYHRVLRVARTLADLDGRDTVARVHVAEALSYRQPAQAPLMQAAE
jgi:magnesium chelatase family protein